MFKALIAALIACAYLLLPIVASAATVTGTVRFWDTRGQRSASAGSKLSTAAQTNQTVPNALVWIYDMDGNCIDFLPNCPEKGPNANDDVQVAAWTNSSGVYSASVYDTADVYVLHVYHRLGGGRRVIAADSAGNSLYAATQTVTNVSGNVQLNLNISCPDETDGICENQADANRSPINEAAANLNAAMYDAAETMGAYLPVGEWITGYFPNDPDGFCDPPPGGGVTLGATVYLNSLCVSTASNNQVVAHEMGHIAHANTLQFPQSNWLCSGCSGASEKQATNEGFANFMAGVTYWNQNSANPTYNLRLLEGNTTAGNNGVALQCASNASNPHLSTDNVMRYFWDLYDSTLAGTNENAATDKGSIHLGWIMSVWAEFIGGTDDREASESGTHGRNVEDFVALANPSNTVSERDLNCLTAQENN